MAVHTKGFGSALWASRYSSMVAISSGTLAKMPRRSDLVGQLTEPAFDQVQPGREVGVKCKWNRGCLSSQVGTSVCLWVA